MLSRALTISRGLSFLSSIIIARWRGADAFGIYSLYFITSTSTWQFAQSFDITFIRKAKTLKVKREMQAYLCASLVMKFFYSFVAIAIAGFCSKPIAEYLLLKPELNGALLYGIVSGIFLALDTRSTLSTAGTVPPIFLQLFSIYRKYLPMFGSDVVLLSEYKCA